MYSFRLKNFSIRVTDSETGLLQRKRRGSLLFIGCDIFVVRGQTVTRNGFFVIPKNVGNALMYNFRLKIFSIKAMDVEIGKLQRKGSQPFLQI